MSVLAPAVGAVIAAIVESSVLTHLQVGGLRPDLVFAVGVAVAMVLGFESGMTWAFVGGVTLDLLLPGRSLGSTALTLVLRDGRSHSWWRAPRGLHASWSSRPRPSGWRSSTRSSRWSCWGSRRTSPSSACRRPTWCSWALLDGAIATAAAIVVRAVDLRFGEPERLAW